MRFPKYVTVFEPVDCEDNIDQAVIFTNDSNEETMKDAEQQAKEYLACSEVEVSFQAIVDHISGDGGVHEVPYIG